MPDGLNPIVKRYLKGTVESQGKELTWETDDHGFLFIIDGKYYEVPYKEFIYEGPDQFIQLTHNAVIDRSIVGIYRTIAVYCTELLLHPETFAYYDKRLVTAHLGKLLSGEITTDKGKYKWRVTSESVEVDCKPRASMMYVSHKYYTSEIWALLAPDVPYNVCQMFVIIGNLYIRCTRFNEPEIVLSLKDIQYNIKMRKEAERRQREMEEQRKAEERRRREASAKKYGGGVDIGLGSGGNLYHDEFLNTSETAKAVAASGGVSLPKFGEEEPEFEQIPIDDAVSAPQVQKEETVRQEIEIQPQTQAGQEVQSQAEAGQQQETKQPQETVPEVQEQVQPQEEIPQETVPEIQEQVQPQTEIPQETAPEVQEQMQPQAEIPQETVPEIQEQVQPQAEILQETVPEIQEQVQPQAEMPQETVPEVQEQMQPQAEIPQETVPEIQEQMQPQVRAEKEEEQPQEEDSSYMDAIMQYLEEMDLPTKNPERSIKKYYPEWALEPIKDLTGEEFLKEFAKML